MTNAEIVARFVNGHPGCTVTDVVEATGSDAGTAWFYLIEAEKHGLIRMDNSDGGRWHFFPA